MTWRCHICHQTGTGNYHQHYKKQHYGTVDNPTDGPTKPPVDNPPTRK